MVIDKNTIVEKREDIITADLDGNVVMMSVENGKYYGMDEIATAIWKNIEQPIRVEQLVHILMDEFDVSEEQCQKDVITFLTKLYNEILIKVN
ncbi:lasso peptide biosynthesis PqqD family chaperone [Caproicibacterium sp. BJN0003]|uniref:lasso peptide biosynthesis PqqD family chaperone n=1 Tax=Caproicibacterium sp. BJN0003 TaxID=2994078 RepID=UPI00224F52F7|nr:lasso peptide biosynthesis PqqD family chaperone [Caproicibacterium sp. BJN0003]UZT82597.1 lasso peptide biosynthesis PqqD family chaperone [Caproicibacterium sp. BJN0003]